MSRTLKNTLENDPVGMQGDPSGCPECYTDGNRDHSRKCPTLAGKTDDEIAWLTASDVERTAMRPAAPPAVVEQVTQVPVHQAEVVTKQNQTVVDVTPGCVQVAMGSLLVRISDRPA